MSESKKVTSRTIGIVTSAPLKLVVASLALLVTIAVLSALSALTDVDFGPLITILANIALVLLVVGSVMHLIATKKPQS